jgi:hypothetical protein
VPLSRETPKRKHRIGDILYFSVWFGKSPSGEGRQSPEGLKSNFQVFDCRSISVPLSSWRMRAGGIKSKR